MFMTQSVIGSGISGGWAAKELCEKVSRQSCLSVVKILNMWSIIPRLQRSMGLPASRRAHAGNDQNYPALKRDYPLNERNLDWWANDQESPYTEVKRSIGFCGYHVVALPDGDVRAIAGAIFILKRMPNRVLLSIGLYGIKILRHGTITWKHLPA